MDEGYDLVSGWRKSRKDTYLTRTLPSNLANWLISRVTRVPLHDYGCTLKAYRRDVLEGFRLYGEMHRFIPVFANSVGARITEVQVNHHPRKYGKTKYGLERTVKVILDLFTVKYPGQLFIQTDLSVWRHRPGFDLWQRRCAALPVYPPYSWNNIGFGVTILSIIGNVVYHGISICLDGADRRNAGAHVLRIPAETDLPHPQNHQFARNHKSKYMKILVLIHEFPPVGGGGGRAAQDICLGLVERGHEVTVLTAHLKGLPKEEIMDGIRILRLPSLRREAFRAGLLAMGRLRSFRTLGRLPLYQALAARCDSRAFCGPGRGAGLDAFQADRCTLRDDRASGRCAWRRAGKNRRLVQVDFTVHPPHLAGCAAGGGCQRVYASVGARTL